MRHAIRLSVFLLVFAFTLMAAVPLARPAARPLQDQEKSEQEQKQEKKKKKGGFFSGLRAVTGESSEQQEVTATAGSKTVGEGEQIGDTTPSAADRQAVSAMENYSLPQAAVKKFQEEGQLKPQQ